MTISSATRKAGPYVGNGVSVAFPFTFKVFSESDLLVVKTIVADNSETTLAITADYTVALNSNQNSSPGGTITTTSVLSSAYKLTITSSIPITQETDLTNQGGFYPAVITNAFDKLTIVAQQLAEKLTRSVTLPLSVSSSVSSQFPVPQSRKIIGWDTTALNLVNYSPSEFVALLSPALSEFAPVATFAALASTTMTVGQIITIRCHTSGDFGGGDFIGIAQAHTTTDGGTLINSATAGVRAQRTNYEHLRLEDFGVLTSNANSGALIQLAINAAAGRPLLETRGGTFICTTPFSYDTTGFGFVDGLKIIGAGMKKTIFDNRTGGPLITATSGNSVTDFQYDLNLSHFAITKSIASASTVGIYLTGVFNSIVHSVSVTDQASHGISLVSTIGDATDCYNVEISNCDIKTNGGHGIYVHSETAINGNITIKNNRILSNTGWGIVCNSIISSRITSNGMAYNLAGGVFVGRVGAGNFSKIIEVDNNEFDSNAGIQLKFDQVVAADEHNNYYVVNNSSPVVTELIRITANAINVKSDSISPRVPVSYTGITAFFVESGASLVRLLNPSWSSWQVAGNTKYNNSSTTAIILDTNEYTTAVSAVGVKFPAMQVSSADVNTLDDYKESTYAGGTITPVNFTGTPTLSLATYTKIGNRVFLEGKFDGTVTATAPTSITFDIPFATANVSNSSVGNAVEINSVTIGVVFDPTSGNANTAIISFSSLALGVREIRFSYSYHTA